MATVQSDFYTDLGDILRQTLTRDGYAPAPAADPHEVFCRFFNYRKRAVSSTSRKVEESATFAVPPPEAAGYAALKQKFETGADVRPHLSTRLTDLDYNDALLNDWGIHHFHLGTSLQANGFVTRTGPLLFARVLDDRVLCIQVLSHGSYADEDLLQLWYQNWPDTLARYRLKGLTAGAGSRFTDADLTKLRRAGGDRHRRGSPAVLVEFLSSVVLWRFCFPKGSVTPCVALAPGAVSSRPGRTFAV